MINDEDLGRFVVCTTCDPVFKFGGNNCPAYRAKPILHFSDICRIERRMAVIRNVFSIVLIKSTFSVMDVKTIQYL